MSLNASRRAVSRLAAMVQQRGMASAALPERVRSESENPAIPPQTTVLSHAKSSLAAPSTQSHTRAQVHSEAPNVAVDYSFNPPGRNHLAVPGEFQQRGKGGGGGPP